MTNYSTIKNLTLLTLAGALERFSYWGIQSVLLLYLTQHLQLSRDYAYLLYGAFTSLTFLFSIVGGSLADRWFGFRLICLAGLTFSFFCSLLLAIPALLTLYIGLGLVICGSGLFMP